MCSVIPFAQSNVSVIPMPVELKVSQGTFLLNSLTAFHADKGLMNIVNIFNDHINKSTGFRLKSSLNSGKNTINLEILASPENMLGSEGYRLQVTSESIHISANKPAGIFYGMQTLLQLLPSEIESTTLAKGTKWTIPAVKIMDKPRFAWRGLMFDVSRHFFTKEEVKAFIDNMAMYKYNIMHFHLTDDQGWRLEIKSLPKLTEVGAWNVKKTGRFNYFSAPADDEPRTYGGFYTQDDMKEIIKYAKERFVDIMPEVDVPGHSLAAIASYPDLSCTPGTYKVNSGEQFMNWYDGGFSAMIDNTLCPANEKVYTFLDKVFTEIAALFPFEYIHMGGDECAKNFWEQSAQIKELMKNQNLKDMHEVQAYFVGRVNNIISSKGKKMMGWDEILEGGLVKGASVMSWRGMKGGIEAAKKGHEVVMTPTTHVYLDYMQGDGAIEPPVYASLRLKKSYELDPVPAGVDPTLIKGTQGNIWTEQMFNSRHLEYMVWPRAFAIAEVAWSPKNSKNWDGFVGRVEDHFKRFNYANIKYAPSIYDPSVNVKKDAKGKILVDIETEINGLTVYYSFDNSFPDNYYPSYNGKSIEVPVDAAPMKLISYRNGKPIGRMMTISMDELKKRAK
jgi:hexosaminidase